MLILFNLNYSRVKLAADARHRHAAEKIIMLEETVIDEAKKFRQYVSVGIIHE